MTALARATHLLGSPEDPNALETQPQPRGRVGGPSQSPVVESASNPPCSPFGVLSSAWGGRCAEAACRACVLVGTCQEGQVSALGAWGRGLEEG